MKLITAALLLGAVSAVSGKTSNLRPSRQLQDEVVYGTYLEADIQYADHSDGHLDAIALPDGRILDIEDAENADADVPTRGPGWFRNHGYESGNTQIALTGRVEGSKFKLTKLPPGKALAKGKDKRRLEEDRRRLMTGEKTVVAIRVEALDAMTTSDEATIRNKIFGTSGDVVNLKSQYAACSHGQLNFVPATTGAGINDGVKTVDISPQTVTGVDNSVIRNAANTAAGGKIADYVMQCLPPGTNGGWIAYAYVNHWLSVYNDLWCNYPSAQMHEIGHNLNLAHAGEGTAQYDDQSGMMGYSYGSDESPKMCFNAAKNFQLGWFNDKFQTVDSTNTYWSGDLVGQVNYNTASDAQRVGIKIAAEITGSTEDYYVSFNRAVGYNSGTQEGGNQVLVHKRASADGYSQSWLMAKLNDGESYNDIPNLPISVNEINLSATPAIATVTIGGCTDDTDCDDGLFCNGLETCSNGSCQAGTPPSCNDGISCTIDTCNVDTDSCAHTPDHASCSDGLFCNGVETCSATNGCLPGTPVDCDDGVGCTADVCDESADSCVHTPDHASCSDDLFCNGPEVCDPTNDCQAGSNPCTVGDICDEVNDVCVECTSDIDCDDGLFCNGLETCNNGSCQAGTDACPGQFCIEATDSCADCLNDGDCSDNNVCTGVETCVAGSCVAGTPLACPDDGLFCSGTETCDPIGGCQSGGDPCSASGLMCDETNNVCSECLADSDCNDGAFCNGQETCVAGSCQAGSAPCNSDQICNEATDTCDAAPVMVDVAICQKWTPGTDSCTSPPQSDSACNGKSYGASCGRGGKVCHKLTCQSTSGPGPTPSPPPPPGPGPTCGGLSKGDCKATSGCTGTGNGKTFECVASGASEFCSGSGGFCSADGDCCVGFCKGNGRCS